PRRRGGASAPATAPAAAAGPAAGGEDIDALAFEALLDSLHGNGGIPGIQADGAPGTSAVSDSPTAGSPPAVPLPAPAAPAAPRKPAAAAHQEDPTVRADVRRLDAMVNLVGE